jgi:hypothetical protein
VIPGGCFSSSLRRRGAAEKKPTKKAHVQWEQQVARGKARIAQMTQRLDRVGEIEEGAGVYAEKKIDELARA